MFVFPDWMIDNWIVICILAVSAPIISVFVLAVACRDPLIANGVRVAATLGGLMGVLFVGWIVFVSLSQREFIKTPIPVLVVMGGVFIANCASLAAIVGAVIGFALRTIRLMLRPQSLAGAAANTEIGGEVASSPYTPPACGSNKSHESAAESDNQAVNRSGRSDEC